MAEDFNSISMLIFGIIKSSNLLVSAGVMPYEFKQRREYQNKYKRANRDN